MTTQEDLLKDIRPFIDPMIALFKSRKFILALCGLIVDLLVLFLAPSIPAIAGYRDQLLTIISGFVLSWMGLTTVEDVSKQNAAARIEVAKQQSIAAITTANVAASKDKAA